MFDFWIMIGMWNNYYTALLGMKWTVVYYLLTKSTVFFSKMIKYPGKKMAIYPQHINL